MTVEITCPSCNYSKRIPKEKIPIGVRWITCPRCKNRFELPVQAPALDVERKQRGSASESESAQQASPWENRSELGIWQGIYQTFKAVLFSPENFFGKMTHKGGIREPLIFGLLLGSIGTMFGFFWKFLMMWGGLLSMADGVISQFTMNLIFIGLMVISPLFVTMIIFSTSGILHLLLLIVGGGKNGFEATFRVVSYSQATQVLGLMPFIGGLIGGFWLLIVQIIGLREIHETSYLRVFVALLIPLALIFLLVAGVFIFLFIRT